MLFVKLEFWLLPCLLLYCCCNGFCLLFVYLFCVCLLDWFVYGLTIEFVDLFCWFVVYEGLPGVDVCVAAATMVGVSVSVFFMAAVMILGNFAIGCVLSFGVTCRLSSLFGSDALSTSMTNDLVVWVYVASSIHSCCILGKSESVAKAHLFIWESSL